MLGLLTQTRSPASQAPAIFQGAVAPATSHIPRRAIRLGLDARKLRECRQNSSGLAADVPAVFAFGDVVLFVVVNAQNVALVRLKDPLDVGFIAAIEPGGESERFFQRVVSYGGGIALQ